jgi:hypothetical protein
MRAKEKAILSLDGWAGRREIPCSIVKETPKRFLIRLEADCGLPGRYRRKGDEVYVPKYAIRQEEAQRKIDRKIRSADIEPKNGFHYLLVNGVEAARFDGVAKAVAARDLMLLENQREISR